MTNLDHLLDSIAIAEWIDGTGRKLYIVTVKDPDGIGVERREFVYDWAESWALPITPARA